MKIKNRSYESGHLIIFLYFREYIYLFFWGGGGQFGTLSICCCVHICWSLFSHLAICYSPHLLDFFWIIDRIPPFRLFGVADGEMGRSSDKRGACHPFQQIMRTNFLSRAIVRPLLQMTRYIFSPVSKWNYCTKLNHKSPRTTTLQFYSATFDIIMKLFFMRISKFRREG